MAYGVTHKFKGGTKEQYDATVAVVHPPEGLPEGQIHHFAGETPDGWNRGRDPRLAGELGAISRRDATPRPSGSRRVGSTGSPAGDGLRGRGRRARLIDLLPRPESLCSPPDPFS
jgi:hypothetical protein